MPTFTGRRESCSRYPACNLLETGSPQTPAITWRRYLAGLFLRATRSSKQDECNEANRAKSPCRVATNCFFNRTNCGGIETLIVVLTFLLKSTHITGRGIATRSA